jgi:PTH1 family peptidyl-tRNA hydrolase
MGKHGAKESETIIIYDDVDIPLGTLRIRKDGSAGTHNGMRDIILKAGYTPRLRIGIRKADLTIPLQSYVLGKISKEDKTILSQAIQRAAKAIQDYISHRDFDKLMQEYST